MRKKQCGWLAATLAAVLLPSITLRTEEPASPPPLTPEKIRQLEEPQRDTTVPIYEQAPFDLLYLNPANGNAVLKLSPVSLPERKVPRPLPKSGYLEIEIFDRPGERYRVPWNAVVELKLFEEIILEEAVRLIREKQFDAAYDHLDYLAVHYPGLAGLAETQQLLLLEEARQALSEAHWERAFADLCRLYELNPQHPELPELLGQAADRLTEDRWKNGQFSAARGVVDTLAAWMPQHAVVQKWRETWRKEGADLRQQIEKALAGGEGRLADRLLRKLQQIWPEEPGLKELTHQVQQAYPRFRVGITQTANEEDPTSLVDWGARRTGRLVRLFLVEYTGPGPEGGIYRSAFLSWQLDLKEQILTLRLLPHRPLFEDGRPYTVFDLAQQLANRADRHHPDYFAPWAEVVRQIRTASPDQVVVELTRAHLKPEALLQGVPTPATLLIRSDDRRSEAVGRFVFSSEKSGDSLRVYVRSPHDRRSLPGETVLTGPAEIEEVVFPRGRDAVRALRRGEIDIVDRLIPWEVPLLREAPEIEVRPYVLPLVHMLVPNLQKPLPGNRDFRRALLYATDRERILRSLLGGKEVPGSQVISGPSLVGTSFNDPSGYGSDPQIRPRGYQPALALALAEIAFRQASEIARKRGWPQPKQRELTLVHPPHELAREACRLIQQQWQQIGWTVHLVESPPGVVPPQDFDLLYVEAAIWEPEVDCYRLFDRLIAHTEFFSPQVHSTLLTLGQAVDWPDLGQRLRTLHRWVYEDSTVLPLWQLVEHYAYRSGISGLEKARVSLYQDVETWQLPSK